MAKIRQGIKLKKLTLKNMVARFKVKYTYVRTTSKTNNKKSTKYSYKKKIVVKKKKKYSYT